MEILLNPVITNFLKLITTNYPGFENPKWKEKGTMVADLKSIACFENEIPCYYDEIHNTLIIQYPNDNELRISIKEGTFYYSKGCSGKLNALEKRVINAILRNENIPLNCV